MLHRFRCRFLSPGNCNNERRGECMLLWAKCKIVSTICNVQGHALSVDSSKMMQTDASDCVHCWQIPICYVFNTAPASPWWFHINANFVWTHTQTHGCSATHSVGCYHSHFANKFHFSLFFHLMLLFPLKHNSITPYVICCSNGTTYTLKCNGLNGMLNKSFDFICAREYIFGIFQWEKVWTM